MRKRLVVWMGGGAGRKKANEVRATLDGTGRMGPAGVLILPYGYFHGWLRRVRVAFSAYCSVVAAAASSAGCSVRALRRSLSSSGMMKAPVVTIESTSAIG